MIEPMKCVRWQRLLANRVSEITEMVALEAPGTSAAASIADAALAVHCENFSGKYMSLQALFCDACGSRDLARVDADRYRCSHCGASVLVAAEQRASPVAHAAPPSLRGPLFGVAGLLLAAVFAVVLWQVSVSPRTPRNEVINASTIELSAAAPVQALQGEKAREKLLVMVTNRGTRVVIAPHVAANFYGGSTKLESRSAYAQTSVLRPGESAPVLIEVPPAIAGRPGKAQRHEIALASPLRAVATTDGPVLKFSDARLVERDMHLKLAAGIPAPSGPSPMQSCRASTPLADEDCDGRTDAPDGKNLKEYSDDCGVNTGSCTAGKVSGCDRGQVSKFSITTGFRVQPPFDEDRRFLVCDNTAVYPSAELCDNTDNDCDNIVDDCTLGAGTAPKCCAMVNMCLDLNTNFNYCGSCTGACSMATANACVAGKCMCGAAAACTGARGLCKGGTSCVQCLVDTDCGGTTPRCRGADTCVQCLGNADCAGTPATPACDLTTNTCVTCTVNGDCAGTPTTPYCRNPAHQCVQCLQHSDCGPNKQCNPANNTCVPCVDDSGCGGTTPVCKTATNACVGCTADAQCPGGRCNLATNSCVQCLAGADCALVPGKPQCDPGTHTCVQCVAAANCAMPGYQCLNNVCVECAMDADCKDPNRPRCDPMGYVCRQCLATADCMGRATTPQCNMTSHLCVECLAAADCKDAAKPVCSALDKCVECAADGDCKDMARPRCENTTSYSCVQCLSNADCGALTCNTVTHTCS